MLDKLEKCEVCPRKCRVNRLEGILGDCRASDKIEIALVSKHKFEEPCISGKNGSGTIFFMHCNMHCIYCQNYEISQQNKKGRIVTTKELAKIMLNQQKEGAHNINLVTPTMYAYQIKEAIKIAKENGLNIPIIYNSNGYENIETLKELEGYVDVYLPDLKYYLDEIAIKYSKAPNYFKVATKAILEMVRQVGSPVFDENNMIKKGVMIRHLVLPNHVQNSKNILKWIKENINEDVYINVMAQYFPTYKAKEDNLINRKLTLREYKQVEEFFYSLDFKNGYIQELGKHEEEYVPKWDI